MKQNLRLISIVLCLVMLLSLAACGKSDVRGSVEPGSEPENSAKPVTAEEVTYESGSTEGGVYTNEFIGIGCQLDESWIYFSDAEIAELSGIMQETIDNEDVNKLLESGQQVIDMYATTLEGLATISISIQDLGVLYGATLDEEAYVENAMESTIEALGDSGVTNVNLEKTSAEFAGAERTALFITGSFSEMPIYEEIICIKKGKYMAFITLCSFNEDVTADLAALFYTL